MQSDDIEYIIDIIKYYYNKTIWIEEGHSIWEWDRSLKKKFKRDIKALKWLLKYMKKNKVTVRFYDSY